MDFQTKEEKLNETSLETTPKYSEKIHTESVSKMNFSLS